MKRNNIIQILLTVLVVMMPRISSAQSAYETILRQGDGRYKSGVENLEAKQYATAKTDFDMAVKYYEGALNAPSKPADAQDIIKSKLTSCRARLTEIKKILTPQAAKPKVNATLNVSQKEVAFNENKSEMFIDVEAKPDWEIDYFDKKDWLIADKFDDSHLKLTVSANNESEQRAHLINIINGELAIPIIITQTSANITLTTATDKLVLGPKPERTVPINLNTNATGWEISAPDIPSWLKLEKDADGKRILVHAEENILENPRSFSFKVKAGNQTIEQQIVQNGLYFNLSHETIAFEPRVEVKEIKVNTTYDNGWWNVLDLPEWIKIEKKTEDGLFLSCLENESAVREAIIRIVSGTMEQKLLVVQNEADNYLALAQSRYVFPADKAGRLMISVENAEKLHVDSWPEWCFNIAQPASDNDKTFSLSYKANKEKFPRKGVIRFSAYKKTGKIELWHDGTKIPAELYDEIGPIVDGLAPVKKNGKCGFINASGKQVIPLMYDTLSFFSDNLAFVGIEGKYVYINKNNEELTPIRYDSLGVFNGNVALVKSGDLYGYIDRKGKNITPLKYEAASSFRMSNKSFYATVWLNGKKLFINEKGKEYDPEAEALKNLGK